MLLDDITDYLSSGGVGTPGTDLFAGYLPDAPAAATAVYETGGTAPVHSMTSASNGAVLEQPRVQVVCRAAREDYATARSTAHSVFKLLDTLPKRAINGTTYHWAAAVQSPFLMGRDETGRVLIACNYDVIKDVSA